MFGSWQPTPMKLLGPVLMLGVALASLALAQPAPAQVVAPAQTVMPDADKSAREAPAPPPCTACRGGEAGRPSSSDTIIMTPDGKTVVPRTVIREQADFRLNDALRNVPGINRR
jgi:outer membrane receptor for monomeric catechols